MQNPEWKYNLVNWLKKIIRFKDDVFTNHIEIVETKVPIVALQSQYTINNADLLHGIISQKEIENRLMYEISRSLVEKLIKDKLIILNEYYDPATNTTRFYYKLKVLDYRNISY